MGGMKQDAAHEAGHARSHREIHGGAKSGGPDVMFHTNFPQAGLYKAWGQFMHQGQAITAAFVLNPAPGSPAAGSRSGAEARGVAQAVGGRVQRLVSPLLMTCWPAIYSGPCCKPQCWQLCWASSIYNIRKKR